MSDLSDYLQAVWGKCRAEAWLEVSIRLNGTPKAAERRKKARWNTKHVQLQDLVFGPESSLDGIREMARSAERPDVYLGCMPLAERPEGGRGKGDLRESVPGIWFDIDAVAPGRLASSKGVPLFESWKEGLNALDVFLGSQPQPVEAGVVTNSGFGVHAWVLAEQPLTGDAVELVRRWNLMFSEWARARYGVHVDVVGDRTRVLRLPETVNWRGAEDADSAMSVELLRCDGSKRYRAETLGYTSGFAAELEAERRARIERLERTGSALPGDEALLDGRAALDACEWSDILGPKGWVTSEPEGSNEVVRFVRPKGSGGDGHSSAVVFADAPWVLVVFSEAALLPSWEQVRRGEQMPNTKWRTWVRLKYEGDEMTAAADAVKIGLFGAPLGWPANATALLKEHGEIFSHVRESLGIARGIGTREKTGSGV